MKDHANRCESQPVKGPELAPERLVPARDLGLGDHGGPVEAERLHGERVAVEVDAEELLGPKLEGSIGEGPNHSNFSHQSTVRIRSKI